jgi:hypothetical protein
MPPLPHCSEEILIEELDAAIHSGGRLGVDSEDASKVSHLLQLVGSEVGLAYRARAERLRALIDDAFEQAGDSEFITEDAHYGLRILFGLHPDYLDAKVSVREREAAPFLWRNGEIKPQSFHKRHRPKAAALALRCLQRAYGQKDIPEEHVYETLAEERVYKVNEHRQLWNTQVTTRFRSRVDGLAEFNFFEPLNDDPELIEENFLILSSDASLKSRGPSDTRDGYNHIAIALPRKLRVGDEYTVRWEERLILEEPTDLYANYFVAMEAANDNYRLDLSVEFADDPPSTAWAFKAHPTENLRRLSKERGEPLTIGEGGFCYSWGETERRATYGLKWSW